MKYLELESTDPYFNLACEEYLFENVCEDILMLWKNHNTAVLGYNQNPYIEINHRAAEKHGVKIARRKTGGGTVYHDLGNLNYTVIQNKPYSDCRELVCSALRRLGLDAVINGRNDIEIEGFKISGSAEKESKGRLLHHGTLLLESDMEMLAEILTPDPVKLESKEIDSVRSRVKNICEFAEITEKDIRKALISDLEKYELDEDALEKIKIMASEYASWEFIYAMSPEFEYVNKGRLEKGLAEFHGNIRNGKITECMFKGDFLSRGDVRTLEYALEGVDFIREDIEKVIGKFDLDMLFGEKDAGKIIDLVIGELKC